VGRDRRADQEKHDCVRGSVAKCRNGIFQHLDHSHDHVCLNFGSNLAAAMSVCNRGCGVVGCSFQFSPAAARSLRMTPSALSKLASRLEGGLGARLVSRSTRKFQLTAEGAAFYERSVKVLADIDEAELSAAPGAAPRGRVRIKPDVLFGLNYLFLFPLLPTFLAQHPEIPLPEFAIPSSCRRPRNLHKMRMKLEFPARPESGAKRTRNNLQDPTGLVLRRER
jgi:hypothetical protein